MDYSILSQLTVGVAAVAALAFVVKEFLKHLKSRDEFLGNLLNNHLKHHNEALDKLTEKINEFVKK